ncbi:MAG: hypothetical protein Q9216_002587 [Gyalolechia sp. 2 TL-2023]
MAMAWNIYTTDKVSPRCFPWLWFVRIGQMLLTLIILGLTAANANDFSSRMACSIPSKLGYNLAALWANGLYCVCDSSLYYEPDDYSPIKSLARSLEKRANRDPYGLGAGRVAGKVALNSIIVVTFSFTIAVTIFWIFKNRRSSAAAASTGMTNTSQQPASGSTPVFPNKMDGPYTGPPTEQGSYPAQGQHIPMQQGGYAGPTPNTQSSVYPNTSAQAPMPEYYSQDQSQQAQYPHNHAEMGSHPTEYKSVSPVSGQ